VWVERVGSAPAGFHARRSATSRSYRYVIGCDRAAHSPFRRPFEWALGIPLDGARLGEAAAQFLGEHDFRSFSAVGQDKPHYRCHLTRAEWHAREGGQGFIFHVEADRFLHRMVRFLVGTMVDVARGRRPVGDVGQLLATTDNAGASPPAPPEGLYLTQVRYPTLDEGAQS
jgi:tRNA pseudouridine38-40 synthase